MASDFLPKKLDFPIEFYQQRRMLVYFLIVFIVGFGFLSYDLFYPIPTHGGELSVFIKIIMMLVLLGGVLAFLKQLIDRKPFFIFNRQSIKITQWFKDDIVIAYKDIKAIHVSHGRHAHKKNT